MKDLYRDRYIYLMLLPAIILVAVFSYAPLPGLKMAFQDYNIFRPDTSPWNGIDNFVQIFKYDNCLTAVKNTLFLSVMSIVITFPAPLVFALLINEIQNTVFKKTVQTISYLPHFLSWMSVIGLVASLYSTSGIVNDIIEMFTGRRIMLLAEQNFVVPNVIILSLWKDIGWGSIIFLAAITGVDPELFDAAKLDGANRFQQVTNITIPTIMPTFIIMLIWRMGSLFGDNFDLMYGLQNAFIDFDVISTWIFRNGIQGGSYHLATAFGLMQGAIGFLLVRSADFIAKRVSGTSIF